MLDVKKSPKASLEDKKFIYLLMGFIVALSFVYVAFEWTDREVTVYEVADTEFVFEEELDIIQTAETPPPPPPPPPAPVVVEVLNVVDDTEEVEDIDFTSEDDKNEEIVIEIPVAAPIVEEEEEVIFQVVEKMPEFPGGPQALFEYLNKNMRYPVIAQENGIQGRVICQFVVNRDGSIVDIVVVKSIDPSLDKEAIRVIQSMPKWNPGQQRGKSVRVKYTLPVNFKLQ
ncbi:energy transducer TonB [Paludibacter sp. 221]|uniref:energy transducer TonB n=1 Tax=Paludibacter sp. 221 TaxID=2302939 RepID=UPI0013D474D2|nr:energy transducer TonB [Paludibacter sp. 221]NDV47119.1 energy transducer TonB [Paludibacter sp. 221]